MKEYKIIAIRDKTEEALGYVKAMDDLEATSIAAQIKDLDIDEFLKIFKLKERK
tara:strand:- start:5204 stop:5365 length:162 start_codon:yes stop_codon:yes gene_type:complete